MTASDSLENLEDDGLLHANGIDAVTGMPAAPPIAPSEAIGLDASAPRGAQGSQSPVQDLERLHEKSYTASRRISKTRPTTRRPSAGPSCSRPTCRRRFARPSSP